MLRGRRRLVVLLVLAAAIAAGLVAAAPWRGGSTTGAAARGTGPAAPPAASTDPGTTSAAPAPAVGAALAQSVPCPAGAAQRSALALARAQARYALEWRGRTIHVDLRRIAADRALVDALASGQLGAAQLAAEAQLIHHVVQIRVLRGGRAIVDANPTSFDVAGSELVLHGPHGTTLGTLEITLQDIIGFLKLDRHLYHAATVVRGSGGRVLSSLPHAVAPALPESGCVRVAGARWTVSHMSRPGYAGEHLEIWVLNRI